jgi:hypothetical protein
LAPKKACLQSLISRRGLTTWPQRVEPGVPSAQGTRLFPLRGLVAHKTAADV